MTRRISRQSCIMICPGIHQPQLTQDFIAGLQSSETDNFTSYQRENILIFPTQDYPAYSAVHILEFLQRYSGSTKPSLVFISFSAGVAGAIGAAWGWQLSGGTVKAFFAFDGWGVPLYGNFPIHRVSHDRFTHWSSALLGSGEESFYGEPPVEHLDIWQFPHTCRGWKVHPAAAGKPERRTYTTAAEFVTQLLHYYL